MTHLETLIRAGLVDTGKVYDPSVYGSPATATRARLIMRIGEPYTELFAVAQQVRADPVVGKSIRTLHRIAGSLAVKLVRAGRWPITVVP